MSDVTCVPDAPLLFFPADTLSRMTWQTSRTDRWVEHPDVEDRVATLTGNTWTVEDVDSKTKTNGSKDASEERAVASLQITVKVEDEKIIKIWSVKRFEFNRWFGFLLTLPEPKHPMVFWFCAFCSGVYDVWSFLLNLFTTCGQSLKFK